MNVTDIRTAFHVMDSAHKACLTLQELEEWYSLETSADAVDAADIDRGQVPDGFTAAFFASLTNVISSANAKSDIIPSVPETAEVVPPTLPEVF
jgi:hypothetical protein